MVSAEFTDETLTILSPIIPTPSIGLSLFSVIENALEFRIILLLSAAAGQVEMIHPEWKQVNAIVNVRGKKANACLRCLGNVNQERPHWPRA